MKEKLYRLLKEKGIDDEKHRQRLDHELKEFKKYEIITHTNLLKDVDNGTDPHPNILIWYLLGYIHRDPINEEPEKLTISGKAPDIDIDFEDARRGDVIDYIKRRFGQTNVAQVCNVITYSIKSAFQDSARIYGIPAQKAIAVSKTIDETNWNESSAYSQYPEIFEFAGKLLGQMRNYGKHAAAVIIADQAVQKYIPCQYNRDDDILLTEFDGESIAETKLLKLDILGLSTLKIIHDTLDFIKERHGKEIDIHNINFEVSDVYKLFGKGLTTSVFQFESPSMKGYLQKLKPKIFEDIVIMNALFRPGSIPIINNYIRRRHGEEEIKYAHPVLEEVLKPTLGLLVFQEQTINIAHMASGMSLGRADSLRRYMEKWQSKFKNDTKGKKKWKQEFFEGCQKQGRNEKETKLLWEYLINQTGYQFNRSHSLSYATIAYYTAWLKVHYPVEFMCASLNSDKTPVDRLTAECKQLGIEVLYPDVNRSKTHFGIIDDKTVIYGLSHVKNCGVVPAKWISEHAPHKNITDFFTKLKEHKTGTKVNKRVLDSLIQAGAFDKLYSNRRTLYNNYDEWRKKGAKVPFEQFIKTREGTDWNKQEKLELLQDLLTLDISMILYEEKTDEIAQLKSMLDSKALIGIITDVTRKRDRNSNMMAFVSIRDENGVRRYPLFAHQFNESARNLIKNRVLVFKMGKMKSGDLIINKIMVPEI